MTDRLLAHLDETTVAGALRSARVAAGLSVSALARKAETSRAAVHAYELGERDPGITTALRVLRACGYTLTVVPTGDGPSSNARS